MIRYLAAAALAIWVDGWTMPGMAKEPTFEQCTCDLEEPRLTNGASVRNATACWSSPMPDDQWCDITVKALKNDDRHQAIINALDKYRDSPAALAEWMASDALDALKMMEGPENSDYVATMMSVVPDFFPAKDKMIAECVSRFLDSRETHKMPEPINVDNFSCEIGEQSGWLQMTFVANGRSLIFKLAPHD